MRNRRPGFVGALSATMLFSSLALAQTVPPSPAPKNRTAESFQHDLAGIWAGDINVSVFSRNLPSLTPSGEMKFNANKPGVGPRATPHPNDPIVHCNPPGLTRTLLSDAPIQFVQVRGKMFQFLEWYHTWREILTDGRELPKNPDPKWYGSSVGKWQGDIFVVDSTGFDERTWIDRWGYPHSDAMLLQERYRRLDHDTLELTMTLTDPKIFTKPWFSDKKIYKLQSDQELDEGYCVGSEEESFNNRMRAPAAGETGQ